MCALQVIPPVPSTAEGALPFEKNVWQVVALSTAAASRPDARQSNDACPSGAGLRGVGALRVRGASVAISIVATAEAVGRQARPGGGAHEGLGGQVGSGVVLQATEQRDAPVSALDLKALHDEPLFINVRAAGDRACWTDMGASWPR